MNNLKTSSPKDAFGQSLVEIDPMVSALGKGQAPLCQVWLKLAPLLWRRERKCEKFTITTTTTEKLWSEKLFWAFGSGELKTVSKTHYRYPHNLHIRPKSYMYIKIVVLWWYTYVPNLNYMLMWKSILWKSRANIKIIQRLWIFMTHRCFVKFPINLPWSQRLTAYWDPENDTLTHSDKPSCQIWYAYVIGKRGYWLDTKTGKKSYKFDLIKVKDHCCITIMNVQDTMFYFDTPTCQIC